MKIYTICYKKLDGVEYLFRICNLKKNMRIITVDAREAKSFLKSFNNTVFACYKSL